MTTLLAGDRCPCVMERAEVARLGLDAFYVRGTAVDRVGTGLAARRWCFRCDGYGRVRHVDEPAPPELIGRKP
jgi:hypothetical protein